VPGGQMQDTMLVRLRDSATPKQSGSRLVSSFSANQGTNLKEEEA
jgi:hypothetical protein